MATGLLIDLDGTVYQGPRALPGAVAAVAELRAAGHPLCFTTNTTRRPVREVEEHLRGLGVELAGGEVNTALRAAARWLEAEGLRRVYPLVLGGAQVDLHELELVEEGADAVLVGDLAEQWSRPPLDLALRQLLEGARLVAIHRNRYGRGGSGLELDAGAFVAALEYAADAEATVVGKPEASFFEAAAAGLGMAPGDCIVVGDDVHSDVAGARAAGMGAVLLRSGKYRAGDESRGPAAPDAVLDGLAQLPAWLATR